MKYRTPVVLVGSGAPRHDLPRSHLVAGNTRVTRWFLRSVSTRSTDSSSGPVLNTSPDNPFVIRHLPWRLHHLNLTGTKFLCRLLIVSPITRLVYRGQKRGVRSRQGQYPSETSSHISSCQRVVTTTKALRVWWPVSQQGTIKYIYHIGDTTREPQEKCLVFASASPPATSITRATHKFIVHHHGTRTLLSARMRQEVDRSIHMSSKCQTSVTISATMVSCLLDEPTDLNRVFNEKGTKLQIHPSDGHRAAGRDPVSAVGAGPYSLRRRRLTGIGIHIINLRRSDDRLRFIMGIPILIRRRLLSE